MARTTHVVYRRRAISVDSFRLAVWLKILIDEAEAGGLAEDPNWSVKVDRLRRVAAVGDLLSFDPMEIAGRGVERWTDDQLEVLARLAREVATRLREQGELAYSVVDSWRIGGHPIAGLGVGTSPTVPLEPVVNTGTAVVALLSGNLPPEPPEGIWSFAGHDARPQVQRFARGVRHVAVPDALQETIDESVANSPMSSCVAHLADGRAVRCNIVNHGGHYVLSVDGPARFEVSDVRDVSLQRF